MKSTVVCGAAAMLGLTLTALSLPAHADDSFSDGYYVIDGYIRGVDANHNRLIILSNDSQRYNVDDYNADIVFPGTNRPGENTDLSRGMYVRVTGTLLSHSFLEASRVRVTSFVRPQPERDAHGDTDLPHVPIPAVASGSAAQSVITVEGVVSRIDSDSGRARVITDDDNVYTADVHASDVLLPGTAGAGGIVALKHGMRVRLIGTQEADGVIAVDRVRVISAVTADSVPDVSPPVAPLPSAPVVPIDAIPNVDKPTVDVPDAATRAANVDLSDYTGILIDARDLLDIERSPAPTINGPDGDLLYPDRSHVPTPDEVQDESIVRYYRTESLAMDGVAGDHPLILKAIAVVGPAHDGLQLCAEDAAVFEALDKKLHFTRTWKVGFLIPENR